MRLYPKQLRNIHDLEKEKIKLLKQSRELDKQDFLSLDLLFDKDKPKEKSKGGGDMVSMLIGLLPISNPLVKTALKFIGPMLLRRKKKNEYFLPQPNGIKKNSKVKAVALEFLGGYLKWKALELSYKGVRYLIKNRRRKSDPPLIK